MKNVKNHIGTVPIIYFLVIKPVFSEDLMIILKADVISSNFITVLYVPDV